MINSFILISDVSLQANRFPGIGRLNRPIAMDALSDQVLELARKWLENCISSHGICRTSQPAILPTRVLEVKGDGDKIYLKKTNGVEGQYATLSHC